MTAHSWKPEILGHQLFPILRENNKQANKTTDQILYLAVISSLELLYLLRKSCRKSLVLFKLQNKQLNLRLQRCPWGEGAQKPDFLHPSFLPAVSSILDSVCTSGKKKKAENFVLSMQAKALLLIKPQQPEHRIISEWVPPAALEVSTEMGNGVFVPQIEF